MKPAHTPTPWGFDTVNDCSTPLNPRVVIYGKNPEDLDQIASMTVFDDVEGPQENAAFIVRACNSHEALKRVLKDAIAFLKCEIESGRSSDSYWRSGLLNMKQDWQRVLKNAEGK